MVLLSQWGDTCRKLFRAYCTSEPAVGCGRFYPHPHKSFRLPVVPGTQVAHLLEAVQGVRVDFGAEAGGKAEWK